MIDFIWAMCKVMAFMLQLVGVVGLLTILFVFVLQIDERVENDKKREDNLK